MAQRKRRDGLCSTAAAPSTLCAAAARAAPDVRWWQLRRRPDARAQRQQMRPDARGIGASVRGGGGTMAGWQLVRASSPAHA